MIYRTKDGIWGEELAKRYLTDKGYVIIDGNVRVQGVGELDFVALDGDTLVIVEVKARSDDNYGHPLDAVDKRKQKKIVLTTAAYLEQCPVKWKDIRFDVVAILGDKIEHVPDAFYGMWK